MFIHNIQFYRYVPYFKQKNLFSLLSVCQRRENPYSEAKSPPLNGKKKTFTIVVIKSHYPNDHANKNLQTHCNPHKSCWLTTNKRCSSTQCRDNSPRLRHAYKQKLVESQLQAAVIRSPSLHQHMWRVQWAKEMNEAPSPHPIRCRKNASPTKTWPPLIPYPSPPSPQSQGQLRWKLRIKRIEILGEKLNAIC